MLMRSGSISPAPSAVAESTTPAAWTAGTPVPGGTVPGGITVREVSWHHLAAVALREALAGEMLIRDADAMLGAGGPAAVFGADGGTVAYTGVAFTADGLPVGHTALRWNAGDVELAGVYVVPAHRDSGVTAALLAAAETAARGLREHASAGLPALPWATAPAVNADERDRSE
jgi:GNAT superfamily N-acetyltransferase